MAIAVQPNERPMPRAKSMALSTFTDGAPRRMASQMLAAAIVVRM